jgi:hypothetical protein
MLVPLLGGDHPDDEIILSLLPRGSKPLSS